MSSDHIDKPTSKTRKQRTKNKKARLPKEIQKQLKETLKEEKLDCIKINDHPVKATAYRNNTDINREKTYGPHTHLLIQENKVKSTFKRPKFKKKNDFKVPTEEDTAESEATLNQVSKPTSKRSKKLPKEPSSTSDITEMLEEAATKEPYAEEVSNDKQTVLWKPISQKQIDFLSATEDEVLFVGGRGAAKSDPLLVDPLRYIENKNFRGLIIRKTIPELRELIDRCKDLYPKFSPGTRWREQEKMFIFPSGSKIEFGYCEVDTDVERYRGQEFTWIGVDELAQFGDPMFIDKLKACLRTTDPTLKPCFRATSNPDGKGVRILKSRWADLGPKGETIKITKVVQGREFTTTRKWIHATIFDNPLLLKNDPGYVATLTSIDNEILRRQWLYGEFVTEGMAFDEFSRDVHVIEPFEIPRSWVRFRACDWGYSSMSVVLWFAVDYDGNLYVYREYTASKITADEFAKNVLNYERGEHIQYGYLDSSVWQQRGQIGETPAETMMNMGLRWLPADRHKGSRPAGKLLVHKYLKIDPDTEQPKLKIFSNCVELIKELGNLSLDPNNPEDVDTKQVDHAYDALRYGLSSRPDSFAGVSYSGDFDFTYDNRYNYTDNIIDPIFGY